ncbi:hypothetical protein Sjap_018443 [Stephania japonica]|uniref:Uncharacterized protein n=1 Tax=Stephania japonica TaxID=461633 RepID=A0AAP0I813_9MAGN
MMGKTKFPIPNEQHMMRRFDIVMKMRSIPLKGAFGFCKFIVDMVHLHTVTCILANGVFMESVLSIGTSEGIFTLSTTTATTPENFSSSDESSSFTVSYLINSCGLSPESALSASNKVRFKSASKPDLVLHLFRNHGFSNTQIANLITKHPSLLLAKPNKTILTKLEFLKQIGFSEDDIADFLSKDPTFMLRSLERTIKPSCEYLKSLLGTNQKVVAAIKNSRSTWIFQFDLERIISHKVEILRKYGVTEGNIVKLVTARTRSLGNKDDKFEELVGNVSEMGFDPSSSQFVHAIDVLAGMKSDTLEAKLQLIASHGWSRCEIALAIRNQPVLVAL